MLIRGSYEDYRKVHMKKYQLTHEEYAISPLTISPNHAGWASPLLVRLLDGRRIAHHTFCSHKDHGLRFYCPLEKWDEASRYVIRKIQREPAFMVRIQKKSEALAATLMHMSRTIEKADIFQWTGPQLAQFLETTYVIGADLCSYGYIPVITDAVFQHYTHLLKQVITDAVERQRGTLSIPEVLYTLTSSTECIPSRQAQIEKFQLALHIQQKKKDHMARMTGLVHAYYQKWFFVGFGHLGPRMTEEQVAREIRLLAKHRVKTQKDLRVLVALPKQLVREQRSLMHRLKLSRVEQHLFSTARKCAYLKGLRMEALFSVCAEWERILRVMEHRFDVPKALLYYCSVPELSRWLQRGMGVSIARLKARKKFCVWVQESKIKERIYTGDAARMYLHAHRETKKQNELNVFVVHGTVASPGYVEGVVKIVNTVSEMTKVRKGDILVSVATNPALLPAMKKAAAFVTDNGGITSHAAIVAREMRKPCIIGTKVATRVFSDGDRVVLDTKTGDVRKIG